MMSIATEQFRTSTNRAGRLYVAFSMVLLAGGGFALLVLASNGLAAKEFATFSTCFAAETVALSIATGGPSRSLGSLLAKGQDPQAVLLMAARLVSLLVILGMFVLFSLFDAKVALATALLLLSEVSIKLNSDFLRYAVGAPDAALAGLGTQRLTLVAAGVVHAIVTTETSASAASFLFACGFASSLFACTQLLITLRRFDGTAVPAMPFGARPTFRQFSIMSWPPGVTETVGMLRTQLLLLVLLYRMPPLASREITFSFRFFALGALPYTFLDVSEARNIAEIAVASDEKLVHLRKKLTHIRHTSRCVWFGATVTSFMGLAAVLSTDALRSFGVTTSSVAMCAVAGAFCSFGALSNTIAMLGNHRIDHLAGTAAALLVGVALCLALPITMGPSVALVSLAVSSLVGSTCVVVALSLRKGIIFL